MRVVSGCGSFLILGLFGGPANVPESVTYTLVVALHLSRAVALGFASAGCRNVFVLMSLSACRFSLRASGVGLLLTPLFRYRFGLDGPAWMLVDDYW